MTAEAEHAEAVEPEAQPTGWAMRALWTVVIVGNACLVLDWWLSTEQGERFAATLRTRIAEARQRASECEGCAKRKEALRRAMNRMHWQAEQIIEGEDAPVEPEDG